MYPALYVQIDGILSLFISVMYDYICVYRRHTQTHKNVTEYLFCLSLNLIFSPFVLLLPNHSLNLNSAVSVGCLQCK